MAITKAIVKVHIPSEPEGTQRADEWIRTTTGYALNVLTLPLVYISEKSR